MELNKETKIFLKSNDNQIIEVGYEVIRDCELLKSSFKFGIVSKEPMYVNVNAESLNIVIQFSQLFKDHADYEPIANMDNGSPPDSDDPGMLFFQSYLAASFEHLLKVADYLQNQRIIDYMIHDIWQRAAHKSVSEMGIFFHSMDCLTDKERAT
uniref:BTB domain-containing protein n=1 Tax=Panagrellus redivivus TaxID=6233 RepID=A0A7E4VSK7_PANRE